MRAALLGARPPALDAVAIAPEAPPKVELTAFCPVIGDVTGECADAKLAKRGVAAIEGVASDADTSVRARQMPAEAEAVFLRFRVANAEEALSKIDAFQNRRTTGATTRGLCAVVDEVNPGAGAVTIERRVPLRDGLNVLQVRAYYLAGIYGQSVELELFRPPAGQTERPDLHVLVVGANQYGGFFSDLAFARADAEALAEEVRAASPTAYGAVTVDHLLGDDAPKDKILAAVGAGPARAAAALVIPVEGEALPPLDASGELNVGDELSLADGGIVAIIHFRSCEELELKGGALKVGPTQVLHRNAEILYRAKGDCPESVDLVDTDAKGAVTLMRGGNEDGKDAGPAAVEPRPRFPIGGDRAAAVDIGVFRDGAEIVRLEVENGRAAWPETAPPLAVGDTYNFVVQDQRADTRGGRFVVSADGPGLIVLSP